MTSLAALLALGSAVALGGPAAQATEPHAILAAAADGCGYADSTADNGRFASTICWLDFSSFDEDAARSVDGQQFEITLEGGYVARFTVKVTDVAGVDTMPMSAQATPLESRFPFGTDAYRGVPGLPALYSEHVEPQVDKGAKLSFENIEVVDPAGVQVTGYSFVAADTEDNVTDERFEWSSDKPLQVIETLAPDGSWGCKAPVGAGTTDMSCDGTGEGASTAEGGKSTALLVSADTPSVFSTQWVTWRQSGIAIGIQTARLTLVKEVSGRIDPADSFDVSITSPEGTVVATASTGSADEVVVGPVTILPRTDDVPFTMGEVVTPGTPTLMSNYDGVWSCVNLNTSSSTVLPSGDGQTKVVNPAIGDGITCTITNTAKTATLDLVKTASPPVDVNSNGLVDVGDTILFTFTVTNTGQLTLSNIAVSDPKVGAVDCPDEALDPGDSVTCVAAAPYVITAADAAAGGVDNTAIATGTPPGTTTLVTSPPSSTHTPTSDPTPLLAIEKISNVATDAQVGDTVEYTVTATNIGNAAYTVDDPATLTDDMTGVLDDAVYNGDASVDRGEVAYAQPKLVWTGELQPGELVTLTYTVTLQAGGDMSVRNVAFAGLPTDPTPACEDPGTESVPCDTVTYPLQPVPPEPVPSKPVPTASLAQTGSELSAWGISAAALLLAAGAVLMIRRRSRA